MIMKKYVATLLFWSMVIGFASAANAQQFTLTGKVFDKATGKALAGASIYLPEIKKGTISNKEGDFSLSLEANDGPDEDQIVVTDHEHT